jgi:hypothetical protein
MHPPYAAVVRHVLVLASCTALACSLQTSGLSPNGEGAGASPSATSVADAHVGDAPTTGPSFDDSGNPNPNGPPDAATPGDDSTDASLPQPDVHVLDPDAGFDASSAPDPCDLDQDGHRSTSAECAGDDCCDYDGRAFPGQNGFFESPDACGSFDFDCDGRSTPRDGVVACKLGFFTCSGDGFKQATACGDNSAFVSCNFAVVTCSQSDSTRTQACR